MQWRSIIGLPYPALPMVEEESVKGLLFFIKRTMKPKTKVKETHRKFIIRIASQYVILNESEYEKYLIYGRVK